MKNFDTLVAELNKALAADGTILYIVRECCSGGMSYYRAQFRSYALLERPSGMQSVPPVGEDFVTYVNNFFGRHGNVKIAFANVGCFYCVDPRYS